MRMGKFEKKFGKYAISNLTMILIICYVAGYFLQYLLPQVWMLLTLNPYAILHGQVWRLVTWLIAPPGSLNLFTIIMLMFYYNIGNSLERAWGTWNYNVYVFTGVLLTAAASFLFMGVYAFQLYGAYGDADPAALAAQMSGMMQMASVSYSTYYISMSLFLAFAATFPEAEVLLMFVIPIKVKWLGIIYAAVLGMEFLMSHNSASGFAIGASLLNFVIFFLRTRNVFRMSPKQIKRRTEFKRQVRHSNRVTKHKCAICGRTDEEDPSLEFRFCSKCNGNYEYCQYHLFTHEHVK